MTPRTFMIYEIVTCPKCDGLGEIQDNPCPQCKGACNMYAPIDLAEALKAFMVDVFGVGTGLENGYGEIVAKEPPSLKGE